VLLLLLSISLLLLFSEYVRTRVSEELSRNSESPSIQVDIILKSSFLEKPILLERWSLLHDFVDVSADVVSVGAQGTPGNLNKRIVSFLIT
jgi:hypothetical protein